MEKKTFVLRVFSAKDIQNRRRYANSDAPSTNRPVWEVRADSIDDALRVSIFYRETDMEALPRTGSLIYVSVESAVKLSDTPPTVTPQPASDEANVWDDNQFPGVDVG